MPSERVLDEWKLRGQLLEDESYARRWAAFWRQTLDYLRDQGTWDDRDVRLLAEYVDWCRLADDHQREAEADPYTVHAESGRRYAHPGFDKARDARVQARECARELGIGPNGRAAAGLNWQGGGGGKEDDGNGGDQEGL